MRRTRRLFLNDQMLARMFDVPDGGVVEHVGVSVDPFGFVVVVSHPDYDEIAEDEASPMAAAEVKVLELPERKTGEVVPVKMYYRWELQP